MISSASDAPAGGSRAADEYLTFFIGGEEYAISLLRIREVISYGVVTRVPGMPAQIRGVTNLRGNVVPVVDLALKFRLPEARITARSCIVLVELVVGGTTTLVGLVTERVGQVLDLAEGELVPAPDFGAPV